jgi:hypothetical protein
MLNGQDVKSIVRLGKLSLLSLPLPIVAGLADCPGEFVTPAVISTRAGVAFEYKEAAEQRKPEAGGDEGEKSKERVHSLPVTYILDLLQMCLLLKWSGNVK